VFREKRQELFLERGFPVMLLLLLDVRDGWVTLRYADAECSVAFLPCEVFV